MKFAGIVVLLYISLLVQQISDHDVFPIMCTCYEPLNVQIGCVNYACFPKSGHIYTYTYVHVVDWL